MDKISEAVTTARAGRAVAVRNRYAGSWVTRFPAINGAGLHIIRQGTLFLIPEHGDAVRLSPGDVVFVPHGPPHGFSDGPCAFRDLPPARTPSPDPEPYDVDFVSCCYHLDRGRGHELLTGLPDVITLRADDPGVRGLADLLGEHASGEHPGDDVALPAIMDLLLVRLLRIWHDGQGVAPSLDPGVARALTSIQENPEKPYSVRQLSALARMSPASFARRFKEVTGDTPGAYLIRRRLGRGAELLRHTDLPLTVIAGRLGYATEFSFSAAFSREYGVAPGRFRRRHRDEPATPIRPSVSGAPGRVPPATR
ncbi:AraC family transcriptional regulator [Actinoplanes philippinensis]|uniref:AraC-type DNA-binding protein n=1 Tax=Actinoplanes philippinensis TaxID=35752 RepID=A0A1I2I5Z9_9ACTN|nr:AraC family transcriptional regulator [Actinoplanes philippinensis]GIE78591.1 AraC family transcriptional regulator [Actinoplanes philippinensis]SFF37614.1 AraC-type DNA-binding protein [Actinoplanes philippinensis]